MAKSWKDLSLDEAVERAKGISRQALHIAIKTYTANGRLDIVEQLLQVRKELKRDNRVARVGKARIEAKEAHQAAREVAVAEFESVETRPVKGIPGWSVARDGRVWSHCHSKWLKPAVRGNGYKALTYGGGNNVYVHRIVAVAYLPNQEGKATVNHINGDKTDNRVENLEWATHKENSVHALDNGLYKLGERRLSAKLTNELALAIKTDLAASMSIKDVAVKHGVSYSIVYPIARGITWKHIKLDK